MLPIVGKLASRQVTTRTRFASAVGRAGYDSLSDERSRKRPTRPITSPIRRYSSCVKHLRNGQAARHVLRDTQVSTLYPGVRDPQKDSLGFSNRKLLRQAPRKMLRDPSSPEYGQSRRLSKNSKSEENGQENPTLMWYGKSGTRWIDPKTGAFKRCVALPDDQELFTRHEVQAAPPMSSSRTIRCWNTCSCVH